MSAIEVAERLQRARRAAYRRFHWRPIVGAEMIGRVGVPSGSGVFLRAREDRHGMPPLQDVMGPAAHHAQPTHGPVAVDVVKAIPMVGGAYLIWPIDILPDVFPVLGQLDDIGVVMASIALFYDCVPTRLSRSIATPWRPAGSTRRGEARGETLTRNFGADSR